MDSPPFKVARLEDNNAGSEVEREDGTTCEHSLDKYSPDGMEVMLDSVPLSPQTAQDDTQASEKGKAHITQPLPEGWVIVAHESGAMVYLHKESRVVTLSRPYRLSTSVTVKRHKIPVAAVPCVENFPELPGSRALIDPSLFNRYLSLRWPSGKMPAPAEFEESERRHVKKMEVIRKKKEESARQPSVPEAISKMVVVDVPKHLCRPGPDGKKSPRAWKVMISSRASVNLLHDFCLKYLRSKLEFLVQEILPSSSLQQPFVCKVMIDGKPHGTGEGPSKKVAKQAAAENTLQSLLPGALKKLSSSTSICEEELQYFSTLSLDAPESARLLKQADMPTPWLILKEYCRRYRGCAGIFDEPELKIDIPTSSSTTATATSSLDVEEAVAGNSSTHSHVEPVSESTTISLAQNRPALQEATTGDESSLGKIEPSLNRHCFYQLTCGPDLCVSGTCLSRKEAKEVGAQALLQKVHPHALHWSTLLEMYVDRHSHFSRVISAHPSSGLSPSTDEMGRGNDDLLSILRQEMRKLRK